MDSQQYCTKIYRASLVPFIKALRAEGAEHEVLEDRPRPALLRIHDKLLQRERHQQRFWLANSPDLNPIETSGFC